MYEEIIYFRNKSNITILVKTGTRWLFFMQTMKFSIPTGEYKTNEMPGTFPSRAQHSQWTIQAEFIS